MLRSQQPRALLDVLGLGARSWWRIQLQAPRARRCDGTRCGGSPTLPDVHMYLAGRELPRALLEVRSLAAHLVSK